MMRSDKSPNPTTVLSGRSIGAKADGAGLVFVEFPDPDRRGFDFGR
jgi:hypothetical protein